MFHGKPEICDFREAFFDENVGGFEVAVDDSFVVDVGVAIEDLVHELHCLILRQSLSGRDEFGEVSSLAQLGDDVGIVFSVVDVVYFYYVFAILQHFKHLDLRGEQILMNLPLDQLHIDYFDGHGFIYIMMDIPVISFLPLKT